MINSRDIIFYLKYDSNPVYSVLSHELMPFISSDAHHECYILLISVKKGVIFIID